MVQAAMDSPTRGKAWAARSSRTLARRLRRSWRRDLGESRAVALTRRTQLAREAIVAHWQLSDIIGAHLPQLGDALIAAKMLHVPQLEQYSDIRDLGNWARHAPPPGRCKAPTW